MEKFASHSQNFITKVHMCAYGMKIPDKNGNQLVYKPTQFLTNSPLLAAQLERKCDKTHQHARLASNRTKLAAIYPPELIDAICKGINEQIKAMKLAQNIRARSNKLRARMFWPRSKKQEQMLQSAMRMIIKS